MRAAMPPTENPGWSLTQEALEQLLARLGPDRERAAREYQRMRAKLADFFDGRGSNCSDVLADETLDRVARRLAEGECVERLPSYAYGVARRVLLEWQKRRTREEAALGVLRGTARGADPGGDAERAVACLERCLAELPEESRALIVAYYREAHGRSPVEGRKLLASRLGLADGALKTRAHRIRVRLQECLRACLQKAGNG